MVAFIAVMRILLSAFTIGISGYMLYLGKDGWGWFLFVGLILGWIGYSKESESNDEKESTYQE